MAQRGVELAVVTAKLSKPDVGSISLRPETLTAFRRAVARRLTLICAPAGYGKTTTAAHLVDRLGLESIWYKLDVLDHDPVVFIVSLVHAIRERDPGFGELLLERVRSSADSPFSLEEMVAMYVAECTERLTDGLHIVLDDYHEAADSYLLNWTLDYLLGSLPPRFRFIVLSRYDPAFSIAKLKLTDEVRFLGVDLLRFDSAQAASVMESRTPCKLSPAAVDRLNELTEGWPASLVLASFALEWLDVDSLETALADPRLKQDIYSYLAEQVFSRESESAQRFLKQTCCLEHVTGELGNKLAGVEDAERRLSELAAKQAFTFASGEEGAYRYHNLFRDYLRQRFLRDHGAEAFHDLQIRTISALEACREIELAVDLSLIINEPARALGIIARTGEPGFDNLRSETLDSWVSRLEWTTAASSPWTRLLRSQVHLRASEFETALSQTEGIVAEFQAEADRLGLYHAYSAQECALFWQGDMRKASAACRLAMEHADSKLHKAHSLISLGSAALEMRDWQSVERSFAEAERLIVGIESPDHQRLRTLRALMKYFRGDVRSAHQEFSTIDIDDKPSGNRASVLNSLGVIEMAMAEYASSRAHFIQALEAADQFGSQHLRPIIQDCLGFCLAATGDVETGLRHLHQSAESRTAQSDCAVLALSLCHIGTVLRRSGRLDEGRLYYEKANDAVSVARDPYVHLNCRANLAFALGLQGSDSIESLREIRESAVMAGLGFIVHKTELFQGIVLVKGDDPVRAGPLFARSVPALLRAGYHSVLLQEARTEPSIIPHFIASMAHSSDVSALAAILGRSPSATPRAQALRTCGLRDRISWRGLTPREHEVLALMAEGARNGEIAERLYLSVATVKTHVNHIFAKLGVTDRVHAVLIYREQESRTLDGSTQPATGNPPWV